MSDFLLPDEEGRLRTNALSASPSAPEPSSGFLLPGEQTAGERAGVTLRSALKVNPDKAAEARRLAGLTETPEPVIERNLEAAKGEVRLREIQQAMRLDPVLARQLSDPTFAKLAHDDVETLASAGAIVRGPTKAIVRSGEFATLVQEIKKNHPGMTWDDARFAASRRAEVNNVDDLAGVIKAPPASFSTIATGLARSLPQGLEKARQGIRSQFADLIGSDSMQADAQARRAQVDFDESRSTPAFESDTARGAYTGGVSLVQQIPALIASVALGNPLPALASAGIMTETEAYGKYRGRGATPGEALTGAVGEGVTEVATELLPMSFLVNKFGKVGVGEFLTGLLAKEVPGEQVATIVQDAIDTAVANPNKTWGEYLKERPDAAYQTLVATVTQAGAMGAIHTAAERLAVFERHAATAEQDTAALTQLAEYSKVSKLAQRDPQSFEQYVTEAAAEGPVQEVFINAAVFAQAMGENLPGVIAASPAVAEQLQEALVGNSDLVIPVGEYAAYIAPTGDALLPHLRTSAEGMSQDEAKVFMQGQAEQFKTEAQKIMDEHEFTSAVKESAAVVERELMAQLQEANRFTDDVNGAYSKLMGSFYAVQATRLGITPEEMYVKYPLRIQSSEATGTRVLDQITPERAKQLNVKTQMPTTPEFLAAVAGTPAAQVTPDGLLVDVVRYQKADQEGAQSVRTGVFYLPKGSPQEKHYKKGTTGYGGREKFEGPTLLRAPLFVKGATGGKAPEAAYNQIKGKGAYEAMRSDVLKVATGWGKTSAQKIEGVTQVLEQYGADGGLAYEIVANSTEGNTLPYAVQENIVAHAVRDAGYDAVVGYSKGKAGLFISEVFDVREQTYPAQGIESEVHAAFDQSARGQIAFGEDITETPSVLTLLKNADLTTFLHEMGHFQLQVLADIASQPDTPAEIVADMAAVLKWFGVPDLATWQGMTIEQQRTHHEKFARGFEAYLFEGKAPSVELNGVFARFRAWMLNVYRQLTSLNVELDDEVRGVMDRLLATNEEILAAEAARGYAPLFKSAEDAGMTPAEWAAYQGLGQDATQEAVDQLQRRSLRDMQWTANARSRVIKELQKDAAAKRREIRIEARREILSEPVYRAWQFLTRRLGPEDKLPPSTPPKSNKNVVDEFTDSMFAAIAKLGGIDRDEVVATWGTDPADKPGSGIFGKPVWRKTEGRSIDDMATSLAQYGYFELDDAGKVDLAQFEEKFKAELRGESQYSNAYDYARDQPMRPGDQVANPAGLLAGRFDVAGLRDIGLPQEIIDHLVNLRMTAKEGLHPDIVADLMGFSSGDELARTVAAAELPGSVIEALTDQRMLERYGDLADQRGIERAANEAIHNDVRARFIATELRALDKAMNVRKKTPAGGSFNVLTKAAKEFAAQIVARKRVRDVRPAQYAAAEARAARGAETAKGLVEKATEKRNQLINHYAARAAYDAVSDVEKGVRYLKKFNNEGTRKSLDIDYRDQIDAMLERFDLRQITNREADKRAALADWIKAQEDQGMEPAISDDLRNEAFRKPYRELTVEEFRGLIDAVKNIEHLARLKHKLLTLKDQREFEAVVGDLARGIADNAKGTIAERRTSDRGVMVSAGRLFRNFFADHRKFASLAREMDGWEDDGTVWNTLVRNMNDAGNFEAVEREKATIKLTELMAPIFKGEKLGAKRYFPTIGKSFTREERLGMALNMGNEVNRERVLTGERLTPQQLQTVLDTLEKSDWDFVQGVWDYLESFRPQIAAKERRLTGIEPEWVEPSQLVTKHGTYKGGYYPIKADPLRSTRAEADTAAEVQKQMERGLYVRSQTRRGHLKARSESTGRAIRYDLAVIVEHVDQVVHDLAWHEYLIDANRLMRAGAVDTAIRNHYGPEKLRTMTGLLTDIAVGDMGAQDAGDRILNHLRQGATIAGLGWRVTTSLLQPLGLTQSMVRIGPKWVAKGAVHWLGDATKLQNSVRLVGEKSDFMRLRAKTMQREINEIRNKVAGEDSRIEGTYFYLIQKMQLVADIPTWWGAYEKAMAADDMTEAKAVALADQAVIDAQGAGQIKDLAAIQRGSPARKLFTNFYSFFSTTYNLTAESVGRTNFKNPGSVGLLATDLLLLYTIPAILGTLMKATLGGDWDDEEKLLKQLAADQMSYLLGTVVGLRELGGGVQAALGLPGSYSGPAGVRFFGEVTKLAKQASQGEADAAFWKALNSAAGVLFHYPAGQINATLEGAAALVDGETENPGALIVGPPR